MAAAIELGHSRGPVLCGASSFIIMFFIILLCIHYLIFLGPVECWGFVVSLNFSLFIHSFDISFDLGLSSVGASSFL